MNILDIDECATTGACGQNSLCINNPGNYTCVCPDGYHGNPYDGVSILDVLIKFSVFMKQEKHCKSKCIAILLKNL